MLVNDGICDCCDCSYAYIPKFHYRDENEIVSANWTNTCEKQNTETINQLIQQYIIESNGIQNAKKSISKKEAIKKLKSSIPHLNKVFFHKNNANQESNKIMSAYQSRGEVTKEQYKQYTIIQRTLQIYKGILSLISKKDKKSLTDLFGDQWTLLPLLLDCFISEPFGRLVMTD